MDMLVVMVGVLISEMHFNCIIEESDQSIPVEIVII